MAPGADRAARMRRLQAMFLEDALAEVAELGRILAAAAPSEPPEAADGMVRKISHDLRGTGGSYGFALVSEKAGILEDALLEGQPVAALEPLAHELAIAVREAHASLQAESAAE